MSLLNNDMKRKIKKAARIARIKPFYQEQRSSAFADRWAIIEPELSTDDRSVLDIGCNIGQFTAKCADRGMFAIGIDAFEEVVARAVKVNRERQNIAFGWCPLAPDIVDSLPATDVTFCMSVHHYWSREHGEDASWDMLAKIAGKTGKLFFEPASSYVRYGDHQPEFLENDGPSIDEYVERNFKRVLGDGCTIRKLGVTASIRQEAFRQLYLVA
jgi:SAM-dependent methyltransferase